MPEEFGICKSFKLGVYLGFFWVFLFMGCLLNMRDVTMSAEWATLIMIAVIIAIFAMVPYLYPEKECEDDEPDE